ncbi:MAG: UDP-N-acetylmuramoyl-tripeptide--D-alanyl-D-alanine ligase [Myxococcales bacterium FL481]|nr:MAG: UDP-N-acetylmuramoyl-tripeptide--D-alanyl-D-alanine ligase [Myxococcales bacterium FL481]
MPAARRFCHGVGSGMADPMRWTPEELAAAAGGTLARRGTATIETAFLDTRQPRANALFVPIVAARDGHDFLDAAVSGQAGAVLVQQGRPIPAGDLTVVVVAETAAALTRLAAHARARIHGPVVAITGSNGKTTTRALTAAGLRTRFRALTCTRGNLNNHLGVPLTLLDLPHDPEAAVVELGMSAPGENDRLARIVCPNVAVVTSIGLEHLETMKTLESIARAEAEVMPHVRTGGAIVIPADEPLLEATLPRRDDVTVLRFGRSPTADVSVEHVALDATTHTTLRLPDGSRVSTEVKNFGAHNALNAAAAMCVAWHLQLDTKAAASAMAEVDVVGHRGRAIEVRGHLLIADCYNANPASMKAALTSLSALRSRRAGPLVAVVGDMLELGPTESELHREVGDLAAQLDLDAVISVGSRARVISDAARGHGVSTYRFDRAGDEVAAWLASWLEGVVGAAVLFKGSRGAALEHVLEPLITRLEGRA